MDDSKPLANFPKTSLQFIPRNKNFPTERCYLGMPMGLEPEWMSSENLYLNGIQISSTFKNPIFNLVIIFHSPTTICTGRIVPFVAAELRF
ncbi:hypothetical protein TNCV_352691 [Trichonephila clavipes]|nr:hypothetical protein TNCV_352691 [Trichonephila clavipes]